MRILGVSQKWPKLRRGKFTTFRFKRRDKVWEVDEEVKVVYKPRSKERELLGIAIITAKERRQFGYIQGEPYNLEITNIEARQDGFQNYEVMQFWFFNQYGDRIFNEPINKLTLKWMCKFTQF